jgi:Phage major capsid protein E
LDSDSLKPFFPEYTTNAFQVVIERYKGGVGLAPIVQPGLPDRLVPFQTVERLEVSPILCRESKFVDQFTINNLRQVGTLNERAGVEVLSKQVQHLVERRNTLWAVLRAQALLGGINYQDPLRGVSKLIPTGIPTTNLVDVISKYGATQGFSDIINSTPIKLFSFQRQEHYKFGKAKPTHLVMNSDLRLILQYNAEVQQHANRDFHLNAGFVSLKDGQLEAIAGMKIIECDTIYEDPAEPLYDQSGNANPNRIKSVWPINKVAMVAMHGTNAPTATVGRTHYCIGESSDGRPGMYVRSGPPTTPPDPEGRYIQLGDSGLPFLVYPEWVRILNVDTLANLTGLVNSIVSGNIPVLGL